MPPGCQPSRFSLQGLRNIMEGRGSRVEFFEDHLGKRPGFLPAITPHRGETFEMVGPDISQNRAVQRRQLNNLALPKTGQISDGAGELAIQNADLIIEGEAGYPPAGAGTGVDRLGTTRPVPSGRV